MKRHAFLIASAIVLVALTAEAHHSFSAEFDINQPIKLTGVLTKMDWVNPHGWIYIDVKQLDGNVVNWAIEAGGPTQLLRRGLRKTDFPERPFGDDEGWAEFLPRSGAGPGRRAAVRAAGSASRNPAYVNSRIVRNAYVGRVPRSGPALRHRFAGRT
jgi:hypothetical protein